MPRQSDAYDLSRFKHLQYDHIFCFPERFSNKNLLGAWKTTSPWNAATRLYCGVMMLKSAVSNGDPSLGSDG